MVDVDEAGAQFSELLKRVEVGERIVISRAGVPVAELGPVRRPTILFGVLAGQITVDDAAFVSADADVAAMFDNTRTPA